MYFAFLKCPYVGKRSAEVRDFGDLKRNPPPTHTG